ncbi:glycerophosphoryl diester phosphodiesterase membrane domain-containing protein [Sphingomicrobium marinum]|uniref:glycerophosphoryl diester phosphodiesterase membrane domain-containing protein n=1 Tax=Sphingomicrobium marinum TaxID=1227950 RepID=UPI00223F6D0D|nr:glycerophosphoryl diester phosphodiesterase membrane domain-containing protein [Sphingomicrobium marinum]
MANLSISKAWDDSRPIIANDGNLMFAVALATVVLPGTLLFMMDPSAGDITAQASDAASDWSMFIVSFIGGLIGIIGSIAISYLALTPGTTVGAALRRGLQRFWVTIGAVLIMMAALAIVAVLAALLAVVTGGGDLEAMSRASSGELATMSGSVLLIVLLIVIAAIILAVRLSLLTPIIAAENHGPLQSLKRSWHLTKGHFWRLLAFFLLIALGALLVMGGIGLIANLALALIFGDPEPMSIGALAYGLVATLLQAAVTVVYSVMVARIYRQLSAETVAYASVPDAGGD